MEVRKGLGYIIALVLVIILLILFFEKDAGFSPPKKEDRSIDEPTGLLNEQAINNFAIPYKMELSPEQNEDLKNFKSFFYSFGVGNG